MLTLCIDTAYRHLACCLIKDNVILASYCNECFKKQSEEVFSALNDVFNNSGIRKNEIDSICISKGPGSYTGTRIAMTIAKVIGEVLPCNVYTISTLKLYAADKDNAMVLMDARANRAYVAVYDKEKTIMDDMVMPISDIAIKDYEIIGDGHLVAKADNYPDICEAFLKTRSSWQLVKDIAFLTPKYLKESESYSK